MLVIADFDNYFYAVRNYDSINALLSDEKYLSIFTWETTTSYDAKFKIKENELREEMILMKNEMHLRPKYIHIRFGDRTWVNKILYICYKLLNLLYTSFYYYFMPFVASIFVWYVLLEENYAQAKNPTEDLSHCDEKDN